MRTSDRRTEMNCGGGCANGPLGHFLLRTDGKRGGWLELESSALGPIGASTLRESSSSPVAGPERSILK